jgi:hypothetical protein
MSLAGYPLMVVSLCLGVSRARSHMVVARATVGSNALGASTLEAALP